MLIIKVVISIVRLLFACVFLFFLLFVSCLISVSLMLCWLVEGHFEHDIRK